MRQHRAARRAFWDELFFLHLMGAYHRMLVLSNQRGYFIKHRQQGFAAGRRRETTSTAREMRRHSLAPLSSSTGTSCINRAARWAAIAIVLALLAIAMPAQAEGSLVFVANTNMR